MTRSRSDDSLSILFTAITTGILKSLIKLMTSIVCGYTLSTADTTNIIMSVTLAPLDLKLLNAS
jgi:hypothetical protein